MAARLPEMTSERAWRAGQQPAPPGTGPLGPRGRWRPLAIALASIGIGALILSLATGGVFTPSHPPPPFHLGLTYEGYTTSNSGIHYAALNVSVKPGLSTGWFRLQLDYSTSISVLAGIPPQSCAVPDGSSYTRFSPDSCGAPSWNWYAVFVYQNLTIASVFGNLGLWLGKPVVLNDTFVLYVITGLNLSAIPYSLSAYPTDGIGVYGTVLLE